MGGRRTIYVSTVIWRFFFCVVFSQAPISSFNLNEKTFVNIKLRLEANQV